MDWNGRICLVLLTAGFSFTSTAATRYVAQRDPQATDDGPGTTERPWKTISRAAASIAPGDVVIIRDGIYRETVMLQTNGSAQAPIRFESAAGADVVLTGADQFTAWRRTEERRPIYEVDWSHRFNTWSRNMTHPDDDHHRVIGRCEQVAIQGYLLHQVLEREQLSPGSFFADVTNHKLLVWDIGGRDLNKVFVEASVRQEILRLEGDYVQLRGLHFQFAANAAQHGAVVLAGRHDQMEDCVVDQMNASGATFAAQDIVVRRCTFRDNGQIGFGANRAHRLLFTDCTVENNNTKGFERGWEAGGDKLVLSRNAVLERSRFLRNHGNGIWFDIGNEDCTVRQCLIAENEDSGLFYEISFGLHAQDNVITGNGFATTPGAWGAQAGIAISSSPGCLIERNLILGNREGFNFREQNRTTPRIGRSKEEAVWNHNETIRNNIIAYNRDAQVWGWFDLKDGRQWPAKAGALSQRSQTNGTPEANLAAAYASTDTKGQPRGLTLEQLKLHFQHNLYYAGAGQHWFEWGVTWGRHESYSSLQKFQAELGIDSGCWDFDPQFVDPLAADLRLRSEMMSRLRSNYPQGEVPDVHLGVR